MKKIMMYMRSIKSGRMSVRFVILDILSGGRLSMAIHEIWLSAGRASVLHAKEKDPWLDIKKKRSRDDLHDCADEHIRQLVKKSRELFMV